MDSEIVIVGAGLSGLAMAATLDSAGISCTLVDRQPLPADISDISDGRTTAISYTSRRMLEALDLWPAQHAAPILDIRVTDGPSRLFLHFDHRDAGDQPMGHLIENRHLRERFQQVVKKAENVQIVTGHGVTDLSRDASGVSYTLGDGSTGRARIIIGADGARSWLRGSVGIRTSGWSYGQSAMICNIRHQYPHNNIAHERFLPGGPFAVLPLAGERASIVWSERDELVPVMIRLDDHAFAGELSRRFANDLGEIEIEGPRSSYPLSLKVAHDIASTRLALVGDAAHQMHPIAGQGFNLGLRDIAALAEILVDRRRLGLDIGNDDGLSRYRRARRVDIATLLAATDGLTWLFSNDIPPVRMARDLGLGLVNKMPRLKTMFMRSAMGTSGNGPRLLRGQPL